MKIFLRALPAAMLVVLLTTLLLELRLRTVAGPSVPVDSSVALSDLRILALGDSITHGGLKEASYPFALKQLLEKALKGKVAGKIQVYNLGITGAETRDLQEKIEPLLQQYRPHVVITMIGAGDRNTAPALRFAFQNLRVLRLLDVAWKSWRNIFAPRDQKTSDDPIAKVADDYYATGRDDVDYIRTVHDPLIVTDRLKIAERNHRMMLLKYPKHEHARVALGLVRAKMGQSDEAEELYKSVIADFEKKSDYRNSVHWAYFSYASLLAELGRDKDLESLLKKLIATYPWNELAYEHLSVLYRRQKKGIELQRLLETGIEKSKSPDRLRLMLARYFRETGHEQEALEQEKTVRELLAKSLLGDQTAPAYRALSQAIVASGALHLAMQYPVLDVSLLESVLGAQSRDLRFVDNGSFRTALMEKQYDYYFLDDFGGLYGHLTQPGAELMAKNVAAVLLPALKERGLAP